MLPVAGALRLASLSLALGLVVQVVALGVLLLARGDLSWARGAVETASLMSWSLVVCAAVAIGASFRSLLAGAAAGLMGAPLGVFASRGVSAALSAAFDAGGAPPGPPLWGFVLLRTLEYGLLGAGVAVLLRRGERGWGPYGSVGAAVGVVFGAGVVAWGAANGAGLDVVVSRATSEVLFPVGCAIVGAATARFVARTE